MSYDFDRVIDRKNTNSLKYDFAKERGMREDALPLWVADMDFQTAPEIIEALHQEVDHGIFGYTEGKDAYFEAVKQWMEQSHQWEVKRNWLIKTPGIVFALAMAVKAYTEKGESVLIQQPVYYPFSEVIVDNQRKLINNSLININGHYEIDFEDFEKKIVDNDVKLFLLCNPHNPASRVWTRDELQKMGEICLKHQVLIVSDEIHSDFIYPGYKHTVLATLSEELADITITCTAPSKTFNLAGLQISNIFISNQKLRRKFRKEVDAAGYSQVNVMGLVACQVAYEKGRPWLEALNQYLLGNLNFVRTFLQEQLPEIKLIEPEGTYLLWLDFRKLNLSPEELEDLIVNQAKLWLDSGAIFGEDGNGYQRINIACPRETLKQALNQLKNAIEQR
ncbi:MAG: pyridoxal phosphate-dependent aminotransferase [Eubacterium sp.]|nr:pyridoxal phosphate-dependent aminotransferase [Eubacterium sp.]